MNKEIESDPEKPGAKADMAKLDAEFIRVLEDLIQVLVDKGVINLTDLPTQALEKLNQRRRVRSRIHNALDLLPDEDDFI
jgi:hypothetical protein